MLAQIGSRLAEFSTIELVFFVSEVVSMGLGLVIAYIAYRGYRRNQSRPMLFIAIGFVFVTGVPTLFIGVFVSGVGVDRQLAGGIIQFFEIVGMASILYALVMDE